MEKEKVKCPHCKREGITVSKDGYLHTHGRSNRRNSRICNGSGMARSLIIDVRKA